jgi:putative spermidine/putrescine transport system substrate-binding protein
MKSSMHLAAASRLFASTMTSCFFKHDRQIRLYAAWMGVLAALNIFGLATASAGEVLRILAWDGYADPEVVAIFQQRTGVSVEVTYVTSDDDLWNKLARNQGRDFDVFAVNTAELQRYIDQGLSVPVDMAYIGNRARQLPRFRDYPAIAGIVRDGKTYAVPYTYSAMGLIYNRKLVKIPPRSIATLWAPEYRGRVLAYNTSNHNFSLAGLRMGVKNTFRMSPGELHAAARQLVDLRRNVLGFYTTLEESVDLFQRHNIAIVFANFGTQQVKALRDAGADIGYVMPREGALAWLDCWAVSSGANNRRLAERWIDFTLEQPISARLTTRHGLANTVTVFPDSQPKDKVIWLEPIENPSRRLAWWNQVLSGTSAKEL